MSEAVLIAVVTATGLVLSGVLVELIRARKRTDTVVQAVTPNGGTSMADSVHRIEAEVHELRTIQTRHGERLAGIEAVVGSGPHRAYRPASRS
jgi:hypothetical protein